MLQEAYIDYMVYGKIYKTTNIINNKIYIGQNTNNNSKYLGSGRLIKEAIVKYGKKNFVRIDIDACYSQEELDEREQYWITFYDSTNRRIGYNIAFGGLGGGGFRRGKMPQAIKDKISKNRRINEYIMVGPNEHQYVTTNFTKFLKEHNLQDGPIWKDVFAGYCDYKGWTGTKRKISKEERHRINNKRKQKRRKSLC